MLQSMLAQTMLQNGGVRVSTALFEKSRRVSFTKRLGAAI
jgi:hypothetical protein